jgi:hypothetical protein
MATFCLSTGSIVGIIIGILIKGILRILMGGGGIGTKTVAKCNPKQLRKMIITRVRVKESIFNNFN